jgi:sensitive to high expression protein 9
VQDAQQKLSEAERQVEQASGKLSTSILSRYHEEQIWSDKIRRMSTWGTWGLMGVNVIIFLVFQFGFEPWRRRRLVRGFEEKVHEALKREKEALALERARQGKSGQPEGGLERIPGDERNSDEARLDAALAAGIQELEAECGDATIGDTPALAAIAAVISKDAKQEGNEVEVPRDPPSRFRFDLEKWKAGVLDLFSDQIISLRKRDVTIIALEGVATGASIVCLILFALRPN